MGRRSRRHKKRFPCGHRAFGRECPICKPRRQAAAAALAQRQTKRDRWRATFAEDPIDLEAFPPRIVKKARNVLQRLESGTPYFQLGGSRLTRDRTIIRIPVTRDYRLLCEVEDGKAVPKRLISHEAYNAIVSNTRR